jgi:anti-sigma regulatory factor (Ser/Thr protein kinase)
MAHENTETFAVELSFTPPLSIVAAVRRLISELVMKRHNDTSLAWRLALCGHELFENAVKASGASGGGPVRISVLADQVERRIVIRTWNRSSAESLEALRSALARSSTGGDAQTHYLALMHKTALQEHGSGLGLARIQAETEMRVRFEEDGHEVCVIAEGAWPPP